jgi:hypothetical protein
MRRLLKVANGFFAQRTGFALIRTERLEPWQLTSPKLGPMDENSVDARDRAWLTPDNGTLLDLRQRYSAMDSAVTTPALWDDQHLTPRDLLYFRGDNAFIWQVRGRHRDPSSYALSYYALKADDREGLLDRLDEDGRFGAHFVEVDGRAVSRDMLDSAGEIAFLLRHAALGPATNILDIGAGYGRLAWRLEQAMEGPGRIFATDADARSTFVCDHYLKLRGAKRAETLPLDQVEARLAGTKIDLALNVHSFSECREEAVAWWLERLAANHVRYLFVVPNEGSREGRRCETSDGRDLEGIFYRFGYRAKVRSPRFPDPLVQSRSLDPVHLHLFELASAR